MKYIIFDLDDTVLVKGVASNKTIETFSKCQKLGHKIVINTARSLPYGKKYIEIFNADYAILNGGALIVDRNYRILYENKIDVNNANLIINELIGKSSWISVESTNGFYTNDANYKNQDAKFFDFTKRFDLDCYKILPMCKDFKYIEDISEKYDLEHTHYLGGNWHRLTKKGVTKWSGIERLLEVTNANVEDTMCFGDDIGDLEMILKANIGVAMSNSVESVLKEAKNITKSVHEDGVAYFLERQLLGE